MQSESSASVLPESPKPSSSKRPIIIVIVLLFFLGFLNSLRHSSGTGSPVSQTPSPQVTSPSPTDSSSPKAEPECLAATAVSDAIGQKLDLVYEEWVPSTKLRWCRYLASESTALAPTQLEYKLSGLAAKDTFQDHKAKSQSQPTFRQLSDQPQAFALVNAVKELHQVNFYLQNNDQYLELSFAPEQLDENGMMEKGFGIAKQIIQ